MPTPCQPSILIIPNDRDFAEAACQFVAAVAASAGFGDAHVRSISEGTRRCLLALMQYSFEPNERASLELTTERIPAGIRISLRDRGLPFGCTGPQPEDGAAENPMFGLGDLFDEVRFNSRGPEGKEIVLIKQLPDPSLADYAAACILEPVDAPAAAWTAESPDTGCTVRPMQPAEAHEVSKVVYRAYGYSYPHEYVYYPDKIQALNLSGEIFSAVAVADGDRIVGHCSLHLWEENPLVAELAQGVVAPGFRSRGCFSKLTGFLIATARSQGLPGLFSEAVTHHPYSQKTGIQHGFRDCGVLLGTIPAHTEFKGIGDTGGRRGSMLLQFKYLQPAAPAALHAPEGHREMIAAIYTHMGSDLRLDPAAGPDNRMPLSPEEGGPADETIHSVKLIRPTNSARIRVDRFGKDPVAAVRSRLKALCLQKWDVVHLLLSLSDPATARWCERFEALGFFFAGILPLGLPSGDALILQYLNNVPLAYESIQTATPFAARLLDYARSHDPNRI